MLSPALAPAREMSTDRSAHKSSIDKQVHSWFVPSFFSHYVSSLSPFLLCSTRRWKVRFVRRSRSPLDRTLTGPFPSSPFRPQTVDFCRPRSRLSSPSPSDFALRCARRSSLDGTTPSPSRKAKARTAEEGRNSLSTQCQNSTPRRRKKTRSLYYFERLAREEGGRLRKYNRKGGMKGERTKRTEPPPSTATFLLILLNHEPSLYSFGAAKPNIDCSSESLADC